MNWQPIETCPRDEWVLLLGEPLGDNGQRYAVGRCSEIVSEWWEQVSDRRKELQSRTEIKWDVDGIYDPSHWMPLPPPPQ